MDRNSINCKLVEVFKKISEPDYSFSSNFCFESLLTHLAKKNPNANSEDIITLPSVSNWLIHAAAQWTGELNDSNNLLKTFILRLTAVATEKEAIFLNLLQNNVYKNIFEATNLKEEKNPSLKLGLLQMVTSMTCHKPGIDWLLETQQWLDVLTVCQLNQTIYFSRAGCTFLATFLWKLNDLSDEENCSIIISKIIIPVVENKWKSLTVIDDGEHSLMEKALLPTFDILIEIMNDVKHFGTGSIIVNLITKKFDLEWNLWNLYTLSRSPTLLSSISKLLFLQRSAKVYADKAAGEALTQSDLREFCLLHCNIIGALISKRDTENVLHLSYYAFVYISKVREYHKISFSIENESGPIEFTDQIMSMNLLPMLSSLRLFKNEFVDLFIEKLVSITSEHTTRSAYNFRDLVREKNDPKMIIKAIHYAVMFKKYLNKSQAVTFFQSFFYGLQEYVPHNETNDNTSNYVVIGVDSWEATNIILTLMDAIYIFIDEFDIPWQESVEVLCVFNFCTRIIKTSNLEPKLTIQAFKLAQLTIKKFLSPNLALLVNSAHGSVIEEIGKNIYGKLHDLSWDIRDSAMELLYIVTDVAEFKFPAFQQQLTDNQLPELVLTMAGEDQEPYVRASALRCVGAMVRIPLLWERHLQYLNMPSKMMKILHEESEGLVRKEAASVMTNIYEHQKFNAAILDDVFLTMFHSAVEDLHWEVQLAALCFWHKVIANQMSHQGMIDGIFPSVTFSKENRKIVTLNEIEIKKRLKKILNELALRGCLGVLLCCMKDESEIEVMEKALKITNEIMELLIKYHLNDLNSVQDASPVISRPVLDMQFLKSDLDITKLSTFRNKADVRTETDNIIINDESTVDTANFKDSIIESIVNENDLNLLANVYANQMKVRQEEAKKENGYTRRTELKDISNMFMEPETFVKTVRETDYRRIIDDKRRWREGISSNIHSLFEDILAEYNTADVNSMDCY